MVGVVRIPWCFAPIVGVLAACTMADDDRCPPGTVYISEGKYCIDEDTGSDGDADADADADAGDADADADADAGDADADADADAGDDGGDDGIPSGLGEICTTDDDCESYESDYCAIDPTTGSGICTTLDCAPGECPEGYQCCDCTESSLLPPKVVCIPDDQAALAGSVANCTCR